MEFDSSGNLKPGEHPISLNEFSENFVYSERFASSGTRKGIYNNFLELLSDIYSKGLSGGISRILIDGSFSTTKLNPNDIDFIIYYNPTDKQQKDLERFLDLNKFLLRRQQNCHFNCLMDYKLDKEFLKDEHRRKIEELKEKQIVNFFKYDRNNNIKGYISIDSNEINGGV